MEQPEIPTSPTEIALRTYILDNPRLEVKLLVGFMREEAAQNGGTPLYRTQPVDKRRFSTGP
jgi:hypothetical protein